MDQVSVQPARNQPPVSATVEAAKKLSRELGGQSVGDAGRPGPVEPRKDSSLPAATKPDARGEVEIRTDPKIETPFLWTRDDAQLLGDAGFDIGYLESGPGHDHWIAAREKMRTSKIYDKWAYIFNRLGWDNPLYIVVAVAAVEYGTGIAQCVSASREIEAKKKKENGS